MSAEPTTGHHSDDVLARLEPLIGVEEDQPSMVASAPVSSAEIRLWCDAVGDHGPAYRDPTFAARSMHGGIVAPPAMLQVWTLPPLDVMLAPYSLPPADLVDNQVNRAYAVLTEFGFSSLIATNLEQDYVRYLRPGDLISATTMIESVSTCKHTRLGDGHFVTSLLTHRDQHGLTVATMRLRVLKFRPRDTDPDAPRGTAVVHPAIDADNAFFWAGLRHGELLIQRCADCGGLRHPPRPACPSCGCLGWDTVAASGRGTVVSFVVSPEPVPPQRHAPSVAALVELAEGTRLVAGLGGLAVDDVRIGMPVVAEFVAVADDLVLPRFVPATDSGVAP